MSAKLPPSGQSAGILGAAMSLAAMTMLLPEPQDRSTLNEKPAEPKPAHRNKAQRKARKISRRNRK